MNHFHMRELTAGGALAGAITGRKALNLIHERIGLDSAEPALVFLDFDGIEVATASFLRESVLEFRDTVRRRRTNLYPIVANANDSVVEELLVLLAPKREVLMLCSLNDSGEVRDAQLVGNLEPKQQLTFDLVRNLGETDARELMQYSHESEEVGQTAWNNRLASLTNLGLLVELSHGRAKRYRPLLLEG